MACRVLAGLVLIAVGVGVPGCARSPRMGGDTESPGAGSHSWKDKDISFSVNEEANLESEKAIKFAMNEWERATGSRVRFHYEGRNRAGLLRDGRNTISFLTHWPHTVPPSTIAYCHNWYDTHGTIIESDIIFNMSLAKLTTLATRQVDCYYIEGLCAHEIGHLLGLGHTMSEGSLMKPVLTIKDSLMTCLDSETVRSFLNLYGSGP